MTAEEMEAEANYFAMCLLMPEDMLRADVQRIFANGIDIENDPGIKLLAKRYGVSEQLLLVRLVDLGLLRGVL